MRLDVGFTDFLTTHIVTIETENPPLFVRILSWISGLEISPDKPLSVYILLTVSWPPISWQYLVQWYCCRPFPCC